MRVEATLQKRSSIRHDRSPRKLRQQPWTFNTRLDQLSAFTNSAPCRLQYRAVTSPGAAPPEFPRGCGDYRAWRVKANPRKNIRQMSGQPASLWPVRAALESGIFSAVIVTTDDDEIAAAAVAQHCPIRMQDLKL